MCHECNRCAYFGTRSTGYDKYEEHEQWCFLHDEPAGWDYDACDGFKDPFEKEEEELEEEL